MADCKLNEIKVGQIYANEEFDDIHHEVVDLSESSTALMRIVRKGIKTSGTVTVSMNWIQGYGKLVHDPKLEKSLQLKGTYQRKRPQYQGYNVAQLIQISEDEFGKWGHLSFKDGMLANWRIEQILEEMTLIKIEHQETNGEVVHELLSKDRFHEPQVYQVWMNKGNKDIFEVGDISGDRARCPLLYKWKDGMITNESTRIDRVALNEKYELVTWKNPNVVPIKKGQVWKDTRSVIEVTITKTPQKDDKMVEGDCNGAVFLDSTETLRKEFELVSFSVDEEIKERTGKLRWLPANKGLPRGEVVGLGGTVDGASGYFFNPFAVPKNAQIRILDKAKEQIPLLYKHRVDTKTELSSEEIIESCPKLAEAYFMPPPGFIRTPENQHWKDIVEEVNNLVKKASIPKTHSMGCMVPHQEPCPLCQVGHEAKKAGQQACKSQLTSDFVTWMKKQNDLKIDSYLSYHQLGTMIHEAIEEFLKIKPTSSKLSYGEILEQKDICNVIFRIAKLFVCGSIFRREITTDIKEILYENPSMQESWDKTVELATDLKKKMIPQIYHAHGAFYDKDLKLPPDNKIYKGDLLEFKTAKWPYSPIPKGASNYVAMHYANNVWKVLDINYQLKLITVECLKDRDANRRRKVQYVTCETYPNVKFVKNDNARVIGRNYERIDMKNTEETRDQMKLELNEMLKEKGPIIQERLRAGESFDTLVEEISLELQEYFKDRTPEELDAFMRECLGLSVHMKLDATDKMARALNKIIEAGQATEQDFEGLIEQGLDPKIIDWWHKKYKEERSK